MNNPLTQLIKTKIQKLEERNIFLFATSFLFFIIAILAIRYQFMLLNYIEWGDESETIVAAKMIAAGMTLYSDIFNHHGPLTFLPGFIIEIINPGGVQAHRVPIIALQWFAIFSIYFSPILKDKNIRNVYTGITLSIMVLYLPDMYGHMYMYQVMAGLFLLIILAQYTLPSIAEPERIGTLQVAAGNMLIASLPFLAITYIPSAMLLFIASIKTSTSKRAIAWLLIGVITNLIFLAYIGSIHGYFVYHFYLNLKILPIYFDYGQQTYLQLLHSAFSKSTNNLLEFMLLSFILLTSAVIAKREDKLIPWRTAFLTLAILGSVIRSGITTGFHALPFFYSLMAFPLVYVSSKERLDWYRSLFCIILMLICLLKLSLLLPADQQKIRQKKIQGTTEFSQLVQQITRSDERIIAYSFNNYEYIASNRLPASGYYFYLPWQEKYNENPLFGVQINACEDIKKSRPKIVMIDKWVVWGRFPWDSYAKCIQKVIDESYLQIPDRPYYIRKDLILKGGADSIPHDIINQNYVNGISKNIAGFIIPNSIQNQFTFNSGLTIRFIDNSTRIVLKKEYIDSHLLIHLHGELLDGKQVGFPHKFEVK